MKKNSTRQYAIALYEATAGAKKEDITAIVSNFASMLAKSRELKKAGRIINEFVDYAKEKEGFVRIDITSANSLDAKTLEAIKKVFGDKVEAVEKIDASLIGGLTIKTKDVILDASIKTQLLKLKQSLV